LVTIRVVLCATRQMNELTIHLLQHLQHGAILPGRQSTIRSSSSSPRGRVYLPLGGPHQLGLCK
jgi:hypothetical protein